MEQTDPSRPGEPATPDLPPSPNGSGGHVVRSGEIATAPSSVPSLVSELRSQEDALRAQARELSRLQQEVFTTAAREANDIVSSARGEVRRVILQARRDLLMLAAQVDVIGNMATDGALPPEGTPRTLFAARQDLREVLHEAGQEFQTVTNYAQALESQTAQFQSLPAPDTLVEPPAEPPMETVGIPLEPAVVPTPPPSPFDELRAAVRSAAPAPTPEPARTGGGTRVFVLAFVFVGLGIVAGTVWWMSQPRQGATATAPAAAPPPSAEPATTETATTPSAAPAPAEPARPPMPSVSVEVQREVWVRLTQDGRVLAARLIEPGETFRITDAREVSIRAGDAGAVLVSVNGADAMPLGGDGQVLTRTILLTQSNAPAASSSPVKPQSDLTPSAPSVTPPPPSPSPSVAPPPDAGDRPVGQTPPATPQARDEPAAPSRPAATPQSLRETPTATNGTAAPTPAPPPAPSNPQAEIARVAERWLDAYYRQDRSAMASLSAAQLILSDERAGTERLPPGLAPVRRDIQDVSVTVFGSDAIYTARVSERLETAPAGSAPPAFVSQMWTMRDGAWRLTNVRIASAASVSRSVR